MKRKIFLGTLRSQARLIAVYCLTLFILAGLSLGIQVSCSTFTNTIKENVESMFGGYKLFISPTTHQAREAILQSPTKNNLTAIQYSTCSIIANNKETKASVIISEDNFHYGALIEGHRATFPNEVVVSREIKDSHHLNLGDSIDCNAKKYVVSGVAILPAHIHKNFITQLQTSPESFSGWFTNFDISNDPELSKFIPTGEIRVTSIDAVSTYTTTDTAQNFTLLWWIISIFLTAGLSIILFYGCLVIKKATKPTRVALESIGASPTLITVLTLVPTATLFILVTLLGALVTQLYISHYVATVGETLGQYWDTIDKNATTQSILYIIAATLVAVVAFIIKEKIWGKKTQNSTLKGVDEKFSKRLLISSFSLIGCGIGSLIITLNGAPLLYFFSPVALAIGFALLGCAVTWLPFAQPLRITGYHSSLPAITYTPLIGIICLLVTMSTISLDTKDRAMNFDKPHADSYLTVGLVTQQGVDYLNQEFPDVMHNAIVFAFPEKADITPRLVGRDYLSCEAINPLNKTCHNWIDMLGFVTSDNGKDLVGKVSPEIAELQDSDDYAIVLLNKNAATPPEVIPITLNKNVDYRLGQAELPGWIADPNLPALKDHGLVLGLERRIYIPNFSHNSATKQQEFKQAALSVASNTALSEPSSLDSDSLHKIIVTINIVALVMVLLLIWLGFKTTKKYSQPLLEIIHDYGPRSRYRWQIQLSFATPYIWAILASALIGSFLAKPEIAGRGKPQAIPIGVSWLVLPGLTIAVISFATLIAIRRGHKRDFLPSLM